MVSTEALEEQAGDTATAFKVTMEHLICCTAAWSGVPQVSDQRRVRDICIQLFTVPSLCEQVDSYRWVGGLSPDHMGKRQVRGCQLSPDRTLIASCDFAITTA